MEAEMLFDVKCYDCGWKGERPAAFEPEEDTPSDILYAFPQPCPECGEESLSLDLDRWTKPDPSFGLGVPA